MKPGNQFQSAAMLVGSLTILGFIIVAVFSTQWAAAKPVQRPFPPLAENNLEKQPHHVQSAIPIQTSHSSATVSPMMKSVHEALVPTQASGVAAAHYLFGVLNDSGTHYADEWARGVRATNLELQWKRYEPQEGVYDWDYIHHLQGVMRALKAQGWYVQLVPGVQYAPQWVFDNYANMYYVNQYGDSYNPDPLDEGDFRVINAPFNPQARALIAGYLTHIFAQGFPQSDPQLVFDSVRVGGGPQGELRYPPATWNGNSNSYWAFDIYAQDPAQLAAIPPEVIGWRPGIDPNPGSVGVGQLLVNPGFEETSANYPLLGWTPDNELQAQFSANGSHSGNMALQVTLTTTGRIHQFLRVEPNTEYVFGGWFRTKDGNNRARWFANQYGSDHQLVPGASFVKLESSATDWFYLTGSLSTSTDTHFLKIELDGDQPGTYFFDDLWLEKSDETDHRTRSLEVPVTFLDWYIGVLSDYQNWQIAEIRKYYSGQLDILYAGKGLRTAQIMGALTNDLHGDGWSEGSSALYAGTAYERHLVAFPPNDPLAILLTGIDADPPDQVDDRSPYPGDWSAARWLATLARRHGLPIWAENSGKNDLAAMELSLQRMHENRMLGLLWGFEAELYAVPNPQGYATIADYQALIQRYANLKEIYLPVLLR